MEAFINRWLWLMSLKELNLIREAIKDQSKQVNTGPISSSNPSATSNHRQQTTSPNELPPPSPASSVGSGSSNSNNHPQQHSSSQPSMATEASNSSHSNQLVNSQKLIGLFERYFKYTEFNMRSQNFWDSNEHQINEIKFLTGI